MLLNAARLKGLVVHAQDGELGNVKQWYFDDETWAVRYLTVDTGGWLDGRTMLISPISMGQIDWETRRLHVRLTKKQIENSPDINIHEPVSRRHEAEYMGYYGYSYYWGGPNLWGPSLLPAGLEAIAAANTKVDPLQRESTDSHLRCASVVTGYHVEATDGEIGHVKEFVLDDEAWAIRYIGVATRNWWPGKEVLVSPTWIERVSWVDSKVYVSLPCSIIQTCPEYLESIPIDREYEDRVFFHYGMQKYWLYNKADHHSSYSKSGR